MKNTSPYYKILKSLPNINIITTKHKSLVCHKYERMCTSIRKMFQLNVNAEKEKHNY